MQPAWCISWPIVLMNAGYFCTLVLYFIFAIILVTVSRNFCKKVRNHYFLLIQIRISKIVSCRNSRNTKIWNKFISHCPYGRPSCKFEFDMPALDDSHSKDSCRWLSFFVVIWIEMLISLTLLPIVIASFQFHLF